MEKTAQPKDAKPPQIEWSNPDVSLLKQSEQLNISIIIDTYEDIFSDFDPRSYSERVLSEDFLSEVRRRHIPHKKGGLEVRFLVPDKMRDQKTEAMIKRRLKNYFREEERSVSRHIASKRTTGYVYIFAGVVLLLAIAFLGFNYEASLVVRVIELLLAPAGWFGMWEGIGKVIERDENLETQLELDRRLSESVFAFIPESEALRAPAQPKAEPGDKEAVKEAIKEGIREVKK